MSDDKKTLELHIRVAAGEAFRAVSSLKGEMHTLSGEFKKLSESDGAAVTRTFEQTKAAADKAAASMKLFGASSGELRNVQAQLKNAAVELVTRGFDPQGDDVKNLVEEYKRLGKEADGLDTANGSNVNSFGDLKRAVTGTAAAIALLKTADKIRELGGFALSTADTFRTARNEFGTLLGDMEAGAGLFTRIKAFNDKTPFSLDALKQATNVLLAAKVPLADLEKQLTQFGDLSQGNAQKFTGYVNAFGKAAARGKADMETLNTYLNQGVPILDALAGRFHVTTEEIAEMAGQGKIGFEDFSAALSDLTAQGGRYFGGMELGSRSLAAMQEGLKESVASLAASFGDMLLPASTQVVGILTDMTNAINESPVLKGLLAGAVVTLSGYLAVLAVKQAVAAAKTWLHYAAQMSLNTALSIGNPLLLGALAAAGAATAAFVMYAAEQQKAADKTNDAALAAREQKDALVAAKTAAEDYVRALEDMTRAERKVARESLGAQLFRMQQNLAELESQLNAVPKTIDTYATAYGPGGQTAKVRTGTNDNPEYTELKAAYDKLKQDISALAAKFDAAGSYEATLSKSYADFGTEWSDKMRTGVAAVMREKEKALDALQQKAREIFKADWADAPQYKSELNALNAYFAGKIEDLNKAADKAAKAAADATAKWKESWGETWAQFEAEQAHDPFAGIESDRAKKLRDAAANNVTPETDKKTIDEINAYYDAKRGAVLEKLAHEEAKLTKTRVDDLEHEFREALKNIDALEAQRTKAAGDSEEAIQAISERFAALRQETKDSYAAEIAKAPLEEARAAIVDWQSSLADALSQGLINLGWFSDEASVILGDLAAQFIDLAASASLGGFEEFGRALAEGENAMDSMSRALAAMMQQILRQLPTMFLQAGLQLIANGQWALGLGFIAAAGAAAFVSGYVDGTVSNAKEDADKAAKENAKGGVYDAYGRAAREYAAGGAFTNQIVSRPTYFRYGGGLGVMGEAGPEAIVPLTRGSDGRLGVSSYGAASAGTAVYVIIQNYTNEDVRTEHSSDADGTQIRKIIIGAVKESIAGGGMDRPLASRYGLRAQGVS